MACRVVCNNVKISKHLLSLPSLQRLNRFPRVCWFSDSQENNKWWQIYRKRKERVKGLPLPQDIKPDAVFANNEICLADIEVYGFDYDYTLARYKPELHRVLYRLGKEALIEKYRYPEEIRDLEFNPDFAIRGLHYDVRKGLLMKIDSFHNIQLGTVHRGLRQVPDEEVLALYNGTHVPLEDMNTFYGTGPMHQLVDLFAPPEMNLLLNVTEYFVEQNIPYDPEYVFYDVRNAVQGVHSSGHLHQEIMSNIERYLENGPEILQFLERLVKAGKKLFVVTNSGFPFIDAGMRHLVGDDWRDLFEIIITQARKPKFFNEATRPFRLYDPKTREESWGRVQNLVKGKVYLQGNFYHFGQMTGWYGSKVLYLGDHVYFDLADPSLKHGWRTGAIIPEIETEVATMNTPDFKAAVQWLTVLQNLLEEVQMSEDGSGDSLLPALLQERNELRLFLKSMCNVRFGSLFRTYHNPTYFSRRLGRFADLYMSSLTNMLNYSANHTFFPRRMALPHEPRVYADPVLDQTDTGVD